MRSVTAALALLIVTPALAAPSSSIDLGGMWKSIALQAPKFPPVHARHEPDGGLYFGDTAWAEGTVRLAEAGVVVFAFEARGPQVNGEYPEMLVEIDGEALEPQHLISEGWHDVVFRVNLDVGRHTIRVHFTNDIYDRALHLDRNLWIRKLTAILGERGDVEDGRHDLGVEGG